MKAFHGDLEIKAKYLARVKAHREADNLVQGTCWEKGKGCTVGCTLEAYEHARYETELGIPEWLARLEDRIFEGLSSAEAQKWPEAFLQAIPVGADLEPVKTPYLLYLMSEVKKIFNHVKYPQVLSAIQGVEQALKTGEGLREARAVASAAARTVWRTDADAAADAAAEATVDTTWTTAATTRAAAEAGKNRQETYLRFSEKLLELLRETK